MEEIKYNANPTLRQMMSIDYGEDSSLDVYNNKLDYEARNRSELFTVRVPYQFPEKVFKDEILDAKVIAAKGTSDYISVLIASV